MESNESFYSIKSSNQNVCGELPFDWVFGEYNDVPKIEENTKNITNKQNNKNNFVYVNNLVVNPSKKIVDSSPKWKKIIEKNSLEKDSKDKKNSYPKSDTSKEKTCSKKEQNKLAEINEPFDFP